MRVCCSKGSRHSIGSENSEVAYVSHARCGYRRVEIMECMACVTSAGFSNDLLSFLCI